MQRWKTRFVLWFCNFVFATGHEGNKTQAKSEGKLKRGHSRTHDEIFKSAPINFHDTAFSSRSVDLLTLRARSNNSGTFPRPGLRDTRTVIIMAAQPLKTNRNVYIVSLSLFALTKRLPAANAIKNDD